MVTVPVKPVAWPYLQVKRSFGILSLVLKDVMVLSILPWLCGKMVKEFMPIYGILCLR